MSFIKFVKNLFGFGKVENSTISIEHNKSSHSLQVIQENTESKENKLESEDKISEMPNVEIFQKVEETVKKPVKKKTINKKKKTEQNSSKTKNAK